MDIHVVMHEEYEAPGAIGIWATGKQHDLSFTRIYQYETLPDQVNLYDMVIILGGPQSPDSSPDEYPYFNGHQEMEWIRMVIDHDKAVLGICLGAQLIGGALGAPFGHSPYREIGVFDIKLTDAGKIDSFCSRLPEQFSVAHWHGDMPGLTALAEVLAYSAGCPLQIVKYRPKVYGFQCHFEFTKETMEGMILSCDKELNRYQDQPFVQDATTLRSCYFDQMNHYLFQFLDYIESTVMDKLI